MSQIRSYTAPDGWVYDYAEPQYITIILPDGSTEIKEDHIYAKFLRLGQFDDIKKYKLVKDPRANA